MRCLRTFAEVVDALDGSSAVSRLLTKELRRQYSQTCVSNWKSSGSCPKQETYPVIVKALEAIGCVADPALWNLGPHHFDHALVMAEGLGVFFNRRPRRSRRPTLRGRGGPQTPTSQLAMSV